MIINCKQTKAKFFFLNKIFLVLLTAMVFFFISSSVSFAPTRVMSDSELSNVDGQTLFQHNTVQWKWQLIMSSSIDTGH